MSTVLFVNIDINQLTLSNRLGLRQQVFVKWTGIACVFAYAGVLGAIWGHCVPVQKNWQVVPYPGGKTRLRDNTVQ